MERQSNQVNNGFYEDLGEGWYEDDLHPIALLRLENATRNPWILERIESLLGQGQNILDIGCGAGFLTNSLAAAGHQVVGVDLSEKSLQVAKARDLTQSVRYIQADALALPFSEHHFDVVCAMDFLEHIPIPEKVIQEAGRLLKPGGLFFFHTFNRNFLSWLIVIKGVEWCVPNTPKNMHLYSHFIKPSELREWCIASDLQLTEIHGLIPHIGSKAFWKSLVTRKVDQCIKFKFSSSLKTGYMGIAQKKSSNPLGT